MRGNAQPPPVFFRTQPNKLLPKEHPSCVYTTTTWHNKPRLQSVKRSGSAAINPRGRRATLSPREAKKKKGLVAPSIWGIGEDSRPLTTSPLHDGHAEGAGLTNQTPIVRGAEQIMTIVVHLETGPQGFFHDSRCGTQIMCNPGTLIAVDLGCV